jgi:hypothetical protein
MGVKKGLWQLEGLQVGSEDFAVTWPLVFQRILELLVSIMGILTIGINNPAGSTGYRQAST